MSKFNVGDKITVQHNGRKGTVVETFISNEVSVAFPGVTACNFRYRDDELAESADNRVKATVRLEVTEPYKGRWPDFDRPASGKVWIDTTFDDCKLQSVLVYSGDLETAQAIYNGRLRLTVNNTLTLVGT